MKLFGKGMCGAGVPYNRGHRWLRFGLFSVYWLQIEEKGIRKYRREARQDESAKRLTCLMLLSDAAPIHLE